MQQLNTFKEVASALREAEGKRVSGEIQQTVEVWHDTRMSPVGVCAVGAIAYVSGMPVDHVWSKYVLKDTWPILALEVTSPEDGDLDDLCEVISILYEDYAWTWP